MSSSRPCDSSANAALAEHACRLLWPGTPHQVLARILPADPLELRARIAKRLAERALLCDAECVLLRAQALCALDACSWRGEPELAVWLDERVEEALSNALADDVCAAPGVGDEPLRALPDSLALDARGLDAACRRFNDLPFEQREAFFALVLDARAGDRLARARGLSLSELGRRARAALDVFRRLATPRASAAESGS